MSEDFGTKFIGLYDDLRNLGFEIEDKDMEKIMEGLKSTTRQIINLFEKIELEGDVDVELRLSIITKFLNQWLGREVSIDKETRKHV